jgi:hypothetical protein
MCGVWREYDIAGVGGGEFTLRLIPHQKVAPLYWRLDTHTHTYRNNKDYLIHIITILCIIEQKEMASEIKKAWGALVEVRREMKPYFEFPENETEAEKEIWKQTLSK